MKRYCASSASMVTVLPLLLWCVACATIPRADCVRAACSTLSHCNEAGNQALEKGEPDLAQCFFERALALDPQAAGARLGLGAALVVTGRPARARSQFRRILQESPEAEAREKAAAWIKVLDEPVRVAVYYAPAEGCLDHDLALARYAGRVVRANVSRFGPFVTTGKDVSFVPADIAALQLTETARAEGAQIALVVRVRCDALEQTRQNSLLYGLLFVYPPITRTTVEVTTEIDAYSVRQQSWFQTFAGKATSGSIFADIAVLSAIDKCVANTIFRLTSRLALDF